MNSENKTSRAVEEALQFARSITSEGNIGPKQVMISVDCLKKFQKMERVLPKALDKLRRYRAEHSGEYIEGTEFATLTKEIEQALAYDPLSPSV